MPGDPDWDVAHSVFAAQNFLAHRGLKSINLFPDRTADLAQHARLRWMTHWPPAHSLLYVAVMSWGFAPGPATKVLVFLTIVLGGLGWLFVAQKLGASSRTLVAIAFAYPWLSFVARAYLDYKNDHLACALDPWVYFAVLGIEPLRVLPVERWGHLLFAALLAGSTILVKFSLTPVIAGSGLYLVYLDGRDLSRPRIARIAAFASILAVPTAALWALNRRWAGENKYPLLGGGLPFHPLAFARNMIAHTVGTASGWELVVIQWNLAMEKWLHHSLPRGVIFVVSLAVLGIWIAYFRKRRWEEEEKRFLVYLGLLTVALCGMLVATTLSSPIRYDFTSDGRFGLPISLGWLLLVAIALGKPENSSRIRSLALYSLLLPVAFSALFFAGRGLFETPALAMPTSKLMWVETKDPAHMAFVAQLEGEHPDLVVPPEGSFMVEFGAPAFYPFFRDYRNDGRVYFASADLKGVAIFKPEDRTVFLEKFHQAASMQQLSAPAGFPYLVYEFEFKRLLTGSSAP